MMTSNEAKEYIQEQLPDFVSANLTKSRGDQYCCPLCGSGTRPGGTGAFSITPDRKHWKCFSCEEGGDIFELYGKMNGTYSFAEQMNALSEMYGVQYERESGQAAHQPQLAKTQEKKPVSSDQEPKADYMDFFLRANSNVGETDYWQKRGLSRETVDRFKIGYVKDWRHPKAPAKVSASPRLIIPTSRSSYLARDTRNPEDIPEVSRKYVKSKVGKVHLFNAEALLRSTQPVFVVEGEIDALSIMEVGGQALALGTTSKAAALIANVESLKKSNKDFTDQPFIICMDNDEAGNKAAEKLKQGFEKLGISSYRENPCGSAKDCNEALCNDRQAFSEAVHAIETDPEEFERAQLEAEKEARREEYMKTSAAAHLQEFINGIADSANTPCIPTHFKELDNLLDGGLYPGLYFIGAVTSAGKTSFVLQVVDQIAESERDVLYFSLEMSRTELMSKSISRNTLKLLLKAGEDTRNAKTARGITSGNKWKNYSDREKDVINSAVIEYSQYAEHIFIHEGIGNIGVEEVKKIVDDHIKYTGETPVVVIDYVQILAPYDVRATDKQNTDKAVLELKRMSRDKNIPVIGISSFNRDSYRSGETVVGLWNFKESGAIEYTSDVLIVLNTAKDESIQDGEARIELHILKNRNGRKTRRGKDDDHPILYRYHMLFNYFEEEGMNPSRRAVQPLQTAAVPERPKRKSRKGKDSNSSGEVKEAAAGDTDDSAEKKMELDLGSGWEQATDIPEEFSVAPENLEIQQNEPESEF